MLLSSLQFQSMRSKFNLINYPKKTFYKQIYPLSLTETKTVSLKIEFSNSEKYCNFTKFFFLYTSTPFLYNQHQYKKKNWLFLQNSSISFQTTLMHSLASAMRLIKPGKSYTNPGLWHVLLWLSLGRVSSIQNRRGRNKPHGLDKKCFG